MVRKQRRYVEFAEGKQKTNSEVFDHCAIDTLLISHGTSTLFMKDLLRRLEQRAETFINGVD
ncbi:hypothetical protein RchiOBHm_Chr5g0052151 [Rosa chinensis]|uniref:Uncharacterized protein n=1 Tax=Rosa chinensis TaxID=74649 RepID=A0A2P6QFL5_ROSCH|nr:hypothetical protein RchiOBHm_Chr5g0052151 [Rosa chinensis]